MKELMIPIDDGPRPVYLRIADGLRTAIDEARLAPGEALPSTRDLALQFGVHRHTVMNALDELVAEGWLEARPRSAYRVQVGLPPRLCLQGTASEDGIPLFSKLDWSQRVLLQNLMSDPLYRLHNPAARFRFNNDGPDLRLLPFDELKSAMRATSRRDMREVLGYGLAAGVPALLDVIATYLRRARGIVDRKIIVTNGSIEGFLIVALLLLGPGKRIAMDRLCFRPIYEQFKLTHTDVVPLPMDAEGTDPDGLARILQSQRLNLIYLTPLHHHPTTITLSIARRRAIYQIAAQHGVPILEDDYDHEFHYRAQPPAPLASHDPLDLVIYASTFSKSLFPSARVGYLAVPESLFLPLCQVRRCTAWQSNGLIQQILADWMREGGFERHAARMRRVYQRRLGHTLRVLHGYGERMPELQVADPGGGMAVWLDTSRDSVAVARRAYELGVGVTSEQFCCVPPAQPGHHLRLSFANMNEDEITLGLELLMRAVREVPRS